MAVIQRTDEEWSTLLKMRSERFAKLASFLAPCPVLEADLWLCFRAMHKDSKWSMFKAPFRWMWADIRVNAEWFWKTKILRKNPDDDSFWE